MLQPQCSTDLFKVRGTENGHWLASVDWRSSHSGRRKRCAVKKLGVLVSWEGEKHERGSRENDERNDE